MSSEILKSKPTIFSYPLQIKRVQRYLVVSSPDWKIQISAGALTPIISDEKRVDINSIGSAVLQVFAEIQTKIDEFIKLGKELPLPYQNELEENKFQKESKLLTIKEVAERMKVSPGTIRRLTRKGLLKAKMTPGGHRRYSSIDIQEFMNLEA